MSALLFAVVIAAAAPTAGDAQLVTGLVATAASDGGHFDVLTAADVRTATDFEASRQLAGCTEESCLVEIANALDARYVVSSTLGTLGDAVVLQLSVLDVKEGKALGRQSLRGHDVGVVSAAVDGAVRTMFAPAIKDGERPRVVVLDVAVVNAATSTPTAPTSPPSSPWAGVVVAGVGIGVGIVGVACDLQSQSVFNETSKNASLSAKDANGKYDESDAWAVAAGVSYVVGGVAIVGGAVLSAVSALE